MVKPSRERSLSTVTWVSAAVALLMIAQQIASKAVRDGFFLDAFDVTALPYAVALASVLSLLAALVLGRVMRDFPPGASVPVIFGVNALLFFVEARLIGTYGKWVAGALFLHIAAFGGAVVSGFWSVINERFDPFTAKKVMGKVAGGATVGGVVGGAVTWLLSDLSPSAILDGLGAANLVCGVSLTLVGQRMAAPKKSKAKAKAERAAGILDGVVVLATQSYPRAIALLVFLVALTTSCFDYLFKAALTTSEAPSGSLVGFFAIFYTATGIATLLVQVLASRHVLKWLGVVPSVGVLPAVVVGFLFAALVFPGLWALVLLRGSAMLVENSIYRSGYELLYTPVAEEQKRSAKILIDLGCDRLGGAAGAGITMVIIAAAAALADRLLMVIAMSLAIVTLGLLWVVRKEYIAALASRIRVGASLNEPTAAGASSEYRAMASTFAGDAAAFQLSSQTDPAGADRYGATSRDAPSGEATASVAPSREELVWRVRAHGVARARTRAPARPFAPASQVSPRLLTTPLLELLSRATADEKGSSFAELRASAPGLVGQLTDILLSARHPLGVRLVAAEVLATVPTSRTVTGLSAALLARTFRVRRAAALGLLRIAAVAPAIRPSRRAMIELADQELRNPTARASADARIERSSKFRTDARGAPITPSLEQVFTLLAVAGDPSALRLALTAVTSPDSNQRGTGLEYLENLLPIDVRSRLVALLEEPEQVRASLGIERDVLDDLAAKLRSRAIDVAELRRRYREAKRARFDQDPSG